MNQHKVKITIIWPDDKWEPRTEQEYMLSCLDGIRESFLKTPIGARPFKSQIINALGRVYAEVEIELAR